MCEICLLEWFLIKKWTEIKSEADSMEGLFNDTHLDERSRNYIFKTGIQQRSVNRKTIKILTRRALQEDIIAKQQR